MVVGGKKFLKTETMGKLMNRRRNVRPWVASGLVILAATVAQLKCYAAVASVDDEDAADGSLTGSSPSSHLTVKLSTSSHHRARVTSDGRSESDLPEIPLVGLGLGNVAKHSRIPLLLAEALSLPTKKRSGTLDEELYYRLIDTSHTESAVEVLVGRSLSRLASKKNFATPTDEVYHVMIKVWQTHLGYGRTVLSVQDSLGDILSGIKANEKDEEAARDQNELAVRIHAVLQYPRCYDDLFSSKEYLETPNVPVKYTSCQEEEDALDAATKEAGASPLLDKEGSWERSYRALEELYHRGTLESIGVSNFKPSDLKKLFELATVGPHIYQGSLETLLTEEGLIEELVKHGVHYQCYDAVSAVLKGKNAAPQAYASLEKIGAKHGGMDDIDGSSGYSAVQVVLGWLVHNRSVGVIPGTQDSGHLAENSPRSLGAMSKSSPREALDIENALKALVTGEDIGDALKKKNDKSFGAGVDSSTASLDNLSESNIDEDGVVATFFNTLDRNVRIFKIHPMTGEQIQLSHNISPGRNGRLLVNHDDVLVAYDRLGNAVKKFRAAAEDSIDFEI